MPNRLAHETSPYLKQHENNPVDWYPWGEEALTRARVEDRPILLSVGYSTCHWCHVMAHESFEDEAIARRMNEGFVCIKVDREEMPDLDSIYQSALQLLGESGGWPLTMFLLPDGTPFYGGTYFPPGDRYGRPGFGRLVDGLAAAYRRDRQAVLRTAGQMADGLRQVGAWGRGDGALGAGSVDEAAARLGSRIDRREGGFAGAPKFPNPTALSLLLRAARRSARAGHPEGAAELVSAVTLTLGKMARGGIYDHLGGGFARYSTDGEWLVPHFEKMLYDNAQLLRLYAEAHQIAPDPDLARVIDETAAYLERDLRAPEGGLYTAQDADSEGLEGLYYVWTPGQLRGVLGEDEARLVERCYDVREGGNWRDPHGHGPVGTSILHVVVAPADAAERALLDAARQRLLAARYRRVPPITDDKMLASSNGLAIAGLAEAGRALGRPALCAAAARTADFVLSHLRDDGGGLRRTFKHGQARRAGTLEDHAYVADGLIALYEAGGQGSYLEEAFRLTELCLARFYSEGERCFYMTAAGDSDLIQRPASVHDGAVPSGMSVCLQNLVRLGDLAGERRFLDVAEAVLRTYHDVAVANPFGFANLLCALDLWQERPAEIVLGGSDRGVEALAAAVAGVYLPNRVVVRAAGAPARLARLVDGKDGAGQDAAAWVCRDFACQRPETDPARLVETLRSL